jgi:hypothetical protein
MLVMWGGCLRRSVDLSAFQALDTDQMSHFLTKRDRVTAQQRFRLDY